MLATPLPTRPFSVVQSLRFAFWRWPDWIEIGFFALNLCSPPPHFRGWTGALVYALLFFVSWRTFDFVFDLIETRFSPRVVKTFWWTIGGAFAIWLTLQIDWNWVARYRLDWAGAGFMLIAGFVTVLFIWPPVSLWNRGVKPLDERFNLTIAYRIGAALGYIAACCAWWAFLTWAIYLICSQPNLWR